MTPEEFRNDLALLGWKQSDFCAKAGVQRDTTSRWANGHTKLPKWVSSFLGAMLEIQRLHATYIQPGTGFHTWLLRDLAKVQLVRLLPSPHIVDLTISYDPNRLWRVGNVDPTAKTIRLHEIHADWVLDLELDQVDRLTRDLHSQVNSPSGTLELNMQVVMRGNKIRLEPLAR